MQQQVSLTLELENGQKLNSSFVIDSPSLYNGTDSTSTELGATANSVRLALEAAKNSTTGLGVNQKWYNVSEERVAAGKSGKNDLKVPIQVLLIVGSTRKDAVRYMTFTVDECVFRCDSGANFGDDYGSASISIIIPPGSSYSATWPDGYEVIQWYELR